MYLCPNSATVHINQIDLGSYYTSKESFRSFESESKTILRRQKVFGFRLMNINNIISAKSVHSEKEIFYETTKNSFAKQKFAS